MQIGYYLIVGVMFYVLVAMSFPLLSAYAGTPRGPTQVTASYTSGSGQLAISGTYFWDECKNKNEKHIVGFAIFIDNDHHTGMIHHVAVRGSPFVFLIINTVGCGSRGNFIWRPGQAQECGVKMREILGQSGWRIPLWVH